MTPGTHAKATVDPFPSFLGGLVVACAMLAACAWSPAAHARAAAPKRSSTTAQVVSARSDSMPTRPKAIPAVKPLPGATPSPSSPAPDSSSSQNPPAKERAGTRDGVGGQGTGFWEDMYERNAPGVVYILSEGLCSGAFVAEDLVLTAAHCVSGTRTIRLGWGKDVRKRGAYEYEGGVIVAAMSVREDLAVLKLPRKHGGKILPLAPPSKTFKAGEPVATIGHPSALSPLSSTGLYEPQLYVLTQGPVAKPNDDLVVADMLVLPGNSGGPVFDPEGRIVGVVSARHRDGDLGYFVPISRVHTLIERARGSLTDERRRRMLGPGALTAHVALEADRYIKSLYGGRQNIVTVAPSITLWRLLRITYTTRVGPQDARKRQWDARAVGQVEVTRLADAEFGLGAGQVFYDDEERSGVAKESPVVVGDAAMGGFRFGAAVPIRAAGKPTLSLGIDLLNVF